MHVRGLVKESLSRKLPYESRLKNDIFTFGKLLRYVCGRMMISLILLTSLVLLLSDLDRREPRSRATDTSEEVSR